MPERNLGFDSAVKVCGFCKGGPVGDAATWVDGKPRPPAPCPRCGETYSLKERLILGTINYVESEDGWHNTHCDASTRQIWNRESGGVDVDFVMDAAELTFEDGSFDEVRMWHTLEHLTAKRAKLAVEQVFRVLRSGGVFDVEVPDMDRLCREWVYTRARLRELLLAGEVEKSDVHDELNGLLQWFYSEDLEGLMDEPHLNAHLSGWNEELLGGVLSDAGFRVGDRLETGLALRYRALKPD